MTLSRAVLLTLALSLLAASLAAWGGASFAMRRAQAAADPLHAVLHHDLNLTAAQKQRIEALEGAYAARRAAREAEMRAANAELARALDRDHAYTPDVQGAVDHFHAAMAALQKDTILHVLAMRAVLTPDQSAAFDRTVDRALQKSPA